MQTILGNRVAWDRNSEGAILNPEELPQGSVYAVTVEVTAVAVITTGIDWAAYYDDLGTLEDKDIATHGAKLPEAAARALFPDVEERYRR